MMINPLLFDVPASTRNWASKAVFGERIWADRTTREIPAQFRSRVPNLANVCSCIGVALLVGGLVALDVGWWSPGSSSCTSASSGTSTGWSCCSTT